MSPSKISLKSTRKRLKIPIKKPPNPVTPKGGISGFNLSNTKFKPKLAAVKRPQIEPKITLLFGELETLSASSTTISIPTMQKIDAIIVDFFMISFKIINENNEAKRGLVAIQNKIRATDDS